MKKSYRDSVARKEKILDLLVNSGNVRVSELSSMLGASSVTIRNDLSELQERGMLTRTHGGAVMREKAYLHVTRSSAMMLNAQKKNALAAACSSHIHDNDTFMVNSGTTAACIVRELNKRRGLTMLTNSVLAVQEAQATMDVTLLGGRYDLSRQYTYGDETIQSLSKYMANKAVLSVDGITQSGLSTQKRDECSIVREMIAHSRHVIIVADSTKLGKTALSFIAPLSGIGLIVTNEDADPEIINRLKEAGLNIELV